MNIKEINFNGCYVKYDGEEVTFGYSTKPQRARCQFLFDNEIKKGKKEFEIYQKPHFETCGVMLDVSRGGVMNYDGVCKMIDAMSTLGMNMLMLYTEAMFYMPKYPKFGYMLGRYSIDELKAIDDYAFDKGIEVIGCIQTLGHLERYLYHGEIPSDSSCTLLAGDERCYEFIEEEIKTMREAFRSNRIHLGMDEARGLGLGGYLAKNGFRDKMDIFNEHLRRVLEITDKYNYSAMIWSDMYYSSTDEHDYYVADYVIPQAAIDNAPENAVHVYWDYYHKEYEYYDKKFKQEERFKNKVAFAGAAWTWDGFLPNFRYSYETSVPALNCSIDHGIDTAIMTLWASDGCETDYVLALSSLPIFSEYCYRGKDCKIGDIYEAGELLNGENAELTEAVSAFWLGENGAVRIGKGIIYSDLLLDTFRRDIDFDNVISTYNNSMNILNKYKDHENYSYYYSVFDAALHKSEIMKNLRNAYDNDDREYLKKVCESDLQSLKEKYKTMYEEFKTRWLKHYKPQGFERYPARFGGMMLRFDYVAETIKKYLDGDIEKILELEEKPISGINVTWNEAAQYIGF